MWMGCANSCGESRLSRGPSPNPRPHTDKDTITDRGGEWLWHAVHPFLFAILHTMRVVCEAGAVRSACATLPVPRPGVAGRLSLLSQQGVVSCVHSTVRSSTVHVPCT